MAVTVSTIPLAEGYLAVPDVAGTKPGVVVIQEWWGLDDHIKDVARRFAEEGYVAIAPDHYHGKVTDEPDEARKLAMELDLNSAIAEVRGAARILKARGDVAGVGVVGFCMGGRISFLSAARVPEVDATVVYYGAGPSEQDIQNIKKPVLAFYAEDDPSVNPGIAATSAAMAAAGKNYTYHTYPGTHHAFFNDTRPQIYNAAAAADSWKWMLRYFRQNLLPK